MQGNCTSESQILDKVEDLGPNVPRIVLLAQSACLCSAPGRSADFNAMCEATSTCAEGYVVRPLAQAHSPIPALRPSSPGTES